MAHEAILALSGIEVKWDIPLPAGRRAKFAWRGRGATPGGGSVRRVFASIDRPSNEVRCSLENQHGVAAGIRGDRFEVGVTIRLVFCDSIRPNSAGEIDVFSPSCNPRRRRDLSQSSPGAFPSAPRALPEFEGTPITPARTASTTTTTSLVFMESSRKPFPFLRRPSCHGRGPHASISERPTRQTRSHPA